MFRKYLVNISALVCVLVLGLGVVSKVQGESAAIPKMYLPLVANSAKNSVFGIELALNNISAAQSSAASAGIYWQRVDGLNWADVQPNSANDWAWSNVSSLDTNLTKVSASGAQPILIIRTSPVWAQLYSGSYCSPMKPANIPDFANFVKEAVKRYSAAAYKVNYYELWNEPDVDRALIPDQNSPYGCWGNPSDPYYGGGYYADMLKQVYPAIKAANPNAQVMIGGLLMDCNPNAGCAPGSSVPGKFFEGILKNGGGPYFDVANFHGYVHYTAGSNPIVSEISGYSKWPAGGVVQGKIDLLRSVMSAYGVNKPIFQSEAALLFDSPSNAAFEQAKADYVVWLYTRNMANGVIGTSWFTYFGGWRNSQLVNGSLGPLPGYQAFKYASQKLTVTSYKGSVSTPAGMKGFAFTGSSREIWGLFSTDGNSHNFTIPAGFLAAYDEFGNTITPSGGVVSVLHPVWIEKTP